METPNGVLPLPTIRGAHFAGPASGGVLGRPRLLPVEPPDQPVLPVNDVMDELENRVWNIVGPDTGEFPVKPLANGRGLNVSIFPGQGPDCDMVVKLAIVVHRTPSFVRSAILRNGEGAIS